MTKTNSNITSMTGFATGQAQSDTHAFSWELKSVNAKSLDVRMRLPAGLEHLEPALKARVGECVARGTIYANLTANRDAHASAMQINPAGLAAAQEALQKVYDATGAALPDAAAILSIKGVADWSDKTGDEPDIVAANETAISQALESALTEFVNSRQTEGQRLHKILNGQIETIDALVQSIEQDPSRSAEVVKARVQSQLALLLTGDTQLDPERLHQEVALLATKADLREELDRLVAHIEAAKDLLKAGGLVGRRLDFLAQEFNREANTICSKSNSANVSAWGVDLKVTIDQLREQVQNIE